VLVEAQVVDRVATRFGIRTLTFDGHRGFFVNGEPVKLLGVCNHQDHAGWHGHSRCAPRLARGADAVDGRQRLAQRAQSVSQALLDIATPPA
jgi:hypothetical protein